MSDDVILTVAGRQYGAWEGAEIGGSLDTVAGSFSLVVNERYAGRQILAEVRQDAACSVSISGETVIQGYVDEVVPSYDATGHKVTVTGRDAAGDLVDCSAQYIGGQKFNADVVGLIAEICKPFKIAVRSDIAGLNPIPEFAIHPSQKAFEAIQQLCSFAAVMPISDGLGNLILTRAGFGGTHAPLKLGVNILKGEGKFSSAERFSHYTVLGQANGGDDVDPDLAIGGRGDADDPGVTRFRPLIMIADFMAVGDQAYQRRAMWEATVRAGRAYRATYTAKDWRDDYGALWRLNALAPVTDDFLAFQDTLLISGRHFSKSEAGTVTTLTVTRREAYELIPMPTGSGIYDATPSGRRVG